MKKLFKYSTPFEIWKINVSELGLIILEIRDTKNKEVFYTCLNLKNGKELWKNFQLKDERYWTSIETLVSNYLVLHKFVKPDLPLHKEVIVIDILQGKVIWQNKDYVFWGELIDSLLVKKYSESDSKIFEINLSSGEVISEMEINSAQKVISDYDINNKYKNFKFTEFLEADNQLNQIIDKIGDNSEERIGTEYIETDNHFIFSYYSRTKNNLFNNNLYILNKENRKLLFKERIAKDTNAPYPDTYFIFNNYLIIMKDKSEIIVLDIS